MLNLIKSKHFILLTLLLCLPMKAMTKQSVNKLPRTIESVKGEVLVKLKSTNLKTLQSYNNILQKIQAKELRRLNYSSLLRVIKYDSDAPLKEVLRILSSSSSIEFAEPNYIYSIESIDNKEVQNHMPPESKFLSQWALFNNGQKIGKWGSRIRGKKGADINMTKVWGMNASLASMAKDVKVAVIDTGITLDHIELNQNIWKNEGENGPWEPANAEEAARVPWDCKNKSCNQKDDDGNGYIDDHSGWNWAVDRDDSSEVLGNNEPYDKNGHGSHCAGIIGAEHNGIGMAGINSSVNLMALKFLDKKGRGTLEGAVEAVAYSIRNGADVINASWGGPGESRALGEVIKTATEKGILFVAAAGNSAENNDHLSRFPANYPYDGVMSIVASDINDRMAIFSSYGKAKTHLAAPGVFILSTVPSGFSFLSGTSMAAPQVAGVAALLIGMYPEFKRNPAAVKQRLMKTSDIARHWRTNTMSGGRLNAYNAVTGTIPTGHLEPKSKLWSPVIPLDIESEHPYSNRSVEEFNVSHFGARWIRLHISKLSVEGFGDYLEIHDEKMNMFDALNGFGKDIVTRAVKGDKVKIILRTDARVKQWGFKVTGYQFML
jgi:thermitase